MQEDGVQHDPDGRLEAEGDVGQTQRRADLGVGHAQLPDRLDRGDAVLPGLLLAGAEGEGEEVDEDVGLAHPPLTGEGVDEPVGDPQLPLGGAGLTLLVDGQRDDGGAVLLDDRHDPGEAALGAVTVLEVHAVDDGASAEALQARLDDGRLGRVQHDRQGAGGRQPGRGVAHVDRPVAPDVVHAQVDHVGPLAHGLPADVDDLLPVGLQQRVAERPRAVGVGPLPHHQHAGVLPEGHGAVERGRAGLDLRRTRQNGPAADALDHLPHVLRRRPAAAADQPHAVLLGEVLQRVRELARGQGVDRPVLAELRQAGIRHHADRHRRVLAQEAQVLAHLGRAGGAVHADHVDAQRLQSGERRTDLRAEQHRAGELHGHLRDEHDPGARGGHGPLGADEGGLGLQQVLAGLDQDGVDAALDHGLALLLVGVAQQGVRGVAQGRQLGARSDRADDPPRPLRGGPGIGGLAGDPGAGVGRLTDPVRDVVLGQVGPVGAERVGLHRVAADREVRVVDRPHDVGPGDAQDLVAALVTLEVLQ